MLAILGLGVKFAVGKGVGTPFAKLHVRLGIELDSASPESGDVACARACCFASLEDPWGESHSGEHQPGKESAWAQTDNHWASILFAISRPQAIQLAVDAIGCRTNVCLVSNRGAGFGIDVDRVVERDAVTLAGVNRSLPNRKRTDALWMGADRSRSRLPQLSIGVTDGECQLADFQHLVSGNFSTIPRAPFSSVRCVPPGLLSVLCWRRSDYFCRSGATVLEELHQD